ncbi:MAG: thiol:disulfide interchange protein DsbA/DsbL [Gammaproteobacteria bacterium]|nr:thiol:disulfide interchange protein DsbA/DsbL [Gammaproteobacteria bacterium]
MKRVIVLLCTIWLIPLAGASSATPPEPEAGSSHLYSRIVPPQPTDAEGKVEVIEVFWYGCTHCYDFEPYLDQWLASKPPDVEFKRMPALFRNSWVAHARAYYTALQLGVLDEIHDPLFNAIHQDKQRLDDEASLRAFFVSHGVSEEDFNKAYNSFTVDSNLKQALIMSQRYGIEGVPSMVVNGKYLTSATFTGSYQKLIEVVDELIEQEKVTAAAP